MHIWESAEPTGYITVTNSQERASVGEAGYRSQYLSHAKRALYHLSYIPTTTHTHTHKYTNQHTHHTHQPPPHQPRTSYDSTGQALWPTSAKTSRTHAATPLPSGTTRQGRQHAPRAWLLVSGCWQMTPVCWLLVAGFWSLDACSSLLAPGS